MTVRAPPTYTGPPAHAAHGLTSQLAKQMQNQGAKGRMYINAGPPPGVLIGYLQGEPLLGARPGSDLP